MTAEEKQSPPVAPKTDERSSGTGNAIADSTIVAWLHCEIPTSGKPAPAVATQSTVDLEDTDGGGPTARETITLFNSLALRIGRARANDLVIENQSVSRFHAVISGSPTGVVLSDISSLNGTFLNGRRISSPVDIATGDVLSIGSIRITVELARGVQQPRIERLQDDSIISTNAAKMATTQVTVLVADVCGFTALSQSLASADVADMLNRWFEIVAKAIRREGGEIDKYIGDCVMALWRGDARSISEQAVRAVRAAERIILETKSVATNGGWKHEQQYPWRCRAALNTGEALVGSVGTAAGRDYTVLGDTVNVAFRLECLASAEGTSLVISESTARHVADHLPVRSLGEVILEGRKDNLEIFTLDHD